MRQSNLGLALLLVACTDYDLVAKKDPAEADEEDNSTLSIGRMNGSA